MYVACFFFFNDTATTEIYTLSLHDALPISSRPIRGDGCSWSRPTWRGTTRGGRRASGATSRCSRASPRPRRRRRTPPRSARDRKSTRLNSSHGYISYAVFCLKKKKKKQRKH